MTADELIAEGRRLARPTVILRSQGEGEFAAVWHPWNRDEEVRCWLTVDSYLIPTAPNLGGRYLSVFANTRSEGGHIEANDEWPNRSGTKLFAQLEEILPPIDAIFANGSEPVGEWLIANNWERNEPFNSNFADARMV